MTAELPTRTPRARWCALVATCLLASGAGAQSAFPPVAWSHPDGTTHWYQVRVVSAGATWDDANAGAANAGGYLATITSAAENAFVFSILDYAEYWQQNAASFDGPWLGAFGVTGPTPAFAWGELEPFTFASWTAGPPQQSRASDRVHFGGAASGRTQTWGVRDGAAKLRAYVVEFSGPTSPLTQGLIARTAKSFDGYTVLNPLGSGVTYMVDPRGRLAHFWLSAYVPGAACYLLPNGNLLRAGDTNNTKFAGGRGGVLEELDWSSNVVWKYELSTPTEVLHHDFVRLPNGNTLAIVWEVKTSAEAIAAGRDPTLLRDGELWPDKIVEVDSLGKIVWQWTVWDHLIQDVDPSKANFGDVAAHPELVDINYGTNVGQADWLHSNALDYNADLDQVLLCVRHFDEIWVIDHSTTTQEAAGHSGGRSGKGGDLLYRWGNPHAYRAGTAAERRLFQQHDAHWIPQGLPGAGNILIFNNGLGRPSGNASSADEIVPPVDATGVYSRTGAAWGPSVPTWTYPQQLTTDFYSPYVSGAQRLPNGNTLVGAGWIGRALEVTSEGEVVWDYINPLSGGAVARQGSLPIGTWLGNAFFRAPRYAQGGPELRGRKLVPGDPVEHYGRALLADGSALPHRARVGSAVELTLQSPGDGGKLHFAGTSITPGLIPVDARFIRLGFDELLPLSMVGAAPDVFVNYFGVLDGSGRATARLALPAMPELVGLDFRTMFFVLDLDARSAVGAVSNTVVVRATPQ